MLRRTPLTTIPKLGPWSLNSTTPTNGMRNMNSTWKLVQSNKSSRSSKTSPSPWVSQSEKGTTLSRKTTPTSPKWARRSSRKCSAISIKLWIRSRKKTLRLLSGRKYKHKKLKSSRSLSLGRGKKEKGNRKAETQRARKRGRRKNRKLKNNNDD